MDTWPEFVKDGDDSTRRTVAKAELTGWEAVVFEVQEILLSILEEPPPAR